MASKRHKRKQCSTKRDYPTEAQAWDGARLRQSHGSGVLRAYHCPHCHHWHIGHIPNQTRHHVRFR